MVDLATEIDTSSDSGITTQQLKSFDIYIQTGSSTYKLEGAVITSSSFDFVPENQFQIRLEGQGKKLTRAGDESFSIPGSAQSESATRTPLIVYPHLTLNSLNMGNIISCNITIQNNIEWTPYETLNDSLAVTGPGNAMFPTTYTLGNRIASGEIRQYQTDNNVTQFDDFMTSTNLIIKAFQVGKPSDGTPFFQLELNPVMFTSRLQIADVYSQSYDFSSLDNTVLENRITEYS